MAASPNGSNLNKGKGTLTDASGNAFTFASTTTKSGVQINKNGASSAFPGAMCVEIWYQKGFLTGKKANGSWFKYTGSTWVTANPATDM